jgi:triosephosphate isomerase
MKIFIANWKMQLSPEESVRTARRFARVFRDYKGRALLCPDFLSLAAVSKILANSNLSLGSQDLSAFDRGAYTGSERNTIITFNIKNFAISHNIKMNVI